MVKVELIVEEVKQIDGVIIKVGAHKNENSTELEIAAGADLAAFVTATYPIFMKERKQSAAEKAKEN